MHVHNQVRSEFSKYTAGRIKLKATNIITSIDRVYRWFTCQPLFAGVPKENQSNEVYNEAIHDVSSGATRQQLFSLSKNIQKPNAVKQFFLLFQTCIWYVAELLLNCLSSIV